MRGLEQIPWLYDFCCWFSELFGLRARRRRLAAGASGRVLEVGSGTGRNARFLGEARLLVGVEPELDALRRARRRAPALLPVRASAHDLPFRTGAFDTVLSALVF